MSTKIEEARLALHVAELEEEIVRLKAQSPKNRRKAALANLRVDGDVNAFFEAVDNLSSPTSSSCVPRRTSCASSGVCFGSADRSTPWSPTTTASRSSTLTATVRSSASTTATTSSTASSSRRRAESWQSRRPG
jgi:hypothetical protein